MAITNFIPAVWSEHLLQDLEKQYVGVAHCTREFEGDIKEKGNVVKIGGLSNVRVSNYQKDTNMSAPESLSTDVQELVINQAKYFNFQIDDIDRVQSSPSLMSAALKKAASALANEADRYIFNLVGSTELGGDYEITSGEEIIDVILAVRAQMMLRSNVEPDDLVIEVSPEVATHILKTKLAIAGDNHDVLEKGFIGNLFGCKVYVSNNIYYSKYDGLNTHRCLLRSKRAIAFAEQLSEIEAYRPELRFADAVKGLYLFGAKVVYPNEIAVLNLNLPISPYENNYDE